ncbi:DUF2500 domain-containing protein [Marinicrinis sediminis]|uniref:DUF2500 domain-containing protein n=1 Tax=Marinicrinis sediminis TaxID=1652465 RepID=A0ABW5R8G5_9BACL
MGFENSFFPDDGLFRTMFMIIMFGFVLFFVMILFSIVKGVGQWRYNNNQPVLSIPAKVVGRRTDVSRRGGHSHHHDGHVHSTSSVHTQYFVTFEVESGDRMEFMVDGEDYGLLIDGDVGKLTFQGTRYKGFERNVKTASSYI